MMMVEKGATSQLIESLVPYGLTCCNPTKVATMEKLGVKHTCEEIKQHIKAGCKLAVICAFAIPFHPILFCCYKGESIGTLCSKCFIVQKITYPGGVNAHEGYI